VFEEVPPHHTALFLFSIQLQLGCSAMLAVQAVASTFRTPVGEL
jgi:hypothetical protein